jgi:hypothetical protein
MLLMPIAGVCAYQPRLITAYAAAGGIFDLDPANAFNALPGLVDYVVLSFQTPFAPAADATEDRLPADTIGNKADTASMVVNNTNSLMRYLKGLVTNYTAARAGYMDELDFDLQGTLTGIKGPGWTNETLKSIQDFQKTDQEVVYTYNGSSPANAGIVNQMLWVTSYYFSSFVILEHLIFESAFNQPAHMTSIEVTANGGKNMLIPSASGSFANLQYAKNQVAFSGAVAISSTTGSLEINFQGTGTDQVRFNIYAIFKGQ